MPLTKRQKEIVDKLEDGWVIKRHLFRGCVVLSDTILLPLESKRLTESTCRAFVGMGILDEPKRYGNWAVYRLKDNYYA